MEKEEFECRMCGKWFPMDHMIDGYCPECWDKKKTIVLN